MTWLVYYEKVRGTRLYLGADGHWGAHAKAHDWGTSEAAHVASREAWEVKARAEAERARARAKTEGKDPAAIWWPAPERSHVVECAP